jgi:hypothetical protein
VRLGLLPFVVLGLCAFAGCGERGASTAKTRSSTTVASVTATLPQPEFKDDADLDHDSYGLGPDPDTTRVFGHPASAADTRVVGSVLRRYYAAAAAQDGLAACKLLYSPLGESVVEDYGSGITDKPTGGETCAVVLSALFKHLHPSFSTDSATLRVVAVRVLRERGSALLSFDGKRPENYMELHRERGTWRVTRLVDSTQPVLVE